MIDSARRPIRVAQVVAGMVGGGLETWLMRVLRDIDRDRFQIDFIAHREPPCHYDEEIRRLGSRVLYCPPPKQPFAYARGLRRLLREHGPYDVVHSHLHHFNGVVLRQARQCGVPLRIAHCHSDTSERDAATGFRRRWYLRTTHHWIDRHASLGLAVSDHAGHTLFTKWGRDARWRKLYCGIDLAPFREPIDRQAVRRQLGLDDDALVLGHIGTFREPKNHEFLIRIAAAVMDREPNACLLLVGDGPLRPAVEQQARRLGIAERTVFAGFVPDPSTLLRAAIDVVVFPSLWEGFALSVLEAQAAGVPCVLSDAITPEAAVVEALVERLPLSLPAEAWAAAVLDLARLTPLDVRASAINRIENSPFDVRRCVADLEQIYAGHDLHN